MTHPLIILLTLIALACMARGVRLQILVGRKARSLREWVINQHPQIWNTLPVWTRKWAMPIIPMSILARQRLARNEVFMERYDEINRLKFSMVRWFMLGLGTACITIIGPLVWEWRW